MTATSRQLQLFSDERVPWESLPEECQHSVQELLSLLIEQKLERLQQTETTTTLETRNEHI